MTKKSDAPAIRFKGFSDAWEQRKLGELALFNPKDELPRTFEYVDLESVVGTEMLSHRTEVKSSAPSRAQRLAHTGDLFYQTVRPYQKNNYLFEKPDNNYVFSTGYAQMRPYVDGYFLLSLVQSERFVKVVLDNCTGTSYPAINANDLAEIEVAAPSDESEAQKIGTIFRCIDNLITLHQRKCALLFSPFQALISMMFTTSTFSWEQRKLGDIADIVGGGTPSTGNQSYWDGDIDWYAPAEIADQIYANSSQKKITGLGYENSSAKMLPPGTVLFTSRAGIGKTAILTRKGCTNQGFQSIVPHRGELDSYFIFSRTEELKRYGELVGAGSTFVEVSGKQMAVMELMMPPTMREQLTIGGFFQQLDHLITLHQRKCISFTGRAGRLISTVNKKRITSSWEQRKLGEIGSVSMCRRIFKEQTSETGDIPFYKIGTFGAEPDAFISRELFEEYKSKYPYPKKGDILISASGSIGRTVEFAGNNEYFQDSNIVWLSHDERLSNSFLKCFYSVVKWAGIEGSTIKRLYNDNILNTVICMPSVPEQEHIGLFFENLDHLITLHQRKPFLMKWRNSDANRNQTNRLVL